MDSQGRTASLWGGEGGGGMKVEGAGRGSGADERTGGGPGELGGGREWEG